MNCKRWILICLTALATTAGAAEPGESRDLSGPGQIVVSGTGTVSIPPTTASFSIVVSTIGATAATASEDNARVSKGVRDALTRSPLDDRDVKGSALSVGPQWEYVEGRRPRRSAYTATNSIDVETDNLSSLGTVIDLALSAGASEITEVSFSARDIEAVRAAALTKAVQAARQEAVIIAKASSGALGALILISTLPQTRGYGLEEIVVTARKRESAGVPSEIVPADIAGDPTIREIPIHSWRLIYQLRDEHVFVLTLVHKRRVPAPEQLRG